jgi:hypothetical protein
MPRNKKLAIKLERLLLGRRYAWSPPARNLVRPVWQRVLARSEVVSANMTIEEVTGDSREMTRPKRHKGKRRPLKRQPATSMAAFLGARSISELS